jgi:hypothetical protein
MSFFSDDQVAQLCCPAKWERVAMLRHMMDRLMEQTSPYWRFAVRNAAQRTVRKFRKESPAHIAEDALIKLMTRIVANIEKKPFDRKTGKDFDRYVYGGIVNAISEIDRILVRNLKAEGFLSVDGKLTPKGHAFAPVQIVSLDEYLTVGDVQLATGSEGGDSLDGGALNMADIARHPAYLHLRQQFTTDHGDDLSRVMDFMLQNGLAGLDSDGQIKVPREAARMIQETFGCARATAYSWITVVRNFLIQWLSLRQPPAAA